MPEAYLSSLGFPEDWDLLVHLVQGAGQKAIDPPAPRFIHRV